MTKDAVRRELRRRRRELPRNARDTEHAQLAAALIARLSAVPPVSLVSYLALPDEADLAAVHAWWWARGEAVWVPRVVGPGTLTWHPVTALSQTVHGSWGIREPDPALVPADIFPGQATILVPGVGFTAAGHRLGQGGGFYDRVLAPHRGPIIGVGYQCQALPDLPSEPHDVLLPSICLGGTWLRSSA